MPRPGREGPRCAAVLFAALLACTAIGPASGEDSLFPFEDSIFEDDLFTYTIIVDDLGTEIYVRIDWEEYETDLDLFLVDPEGTIVAAGVDDELYTEFLSFSPTLTGNYTLGVYAWSSWGTETFYGNSSHSLTKVTEPFGGTIGKEETRRRFIFIEEPARPLFVRLRWDYEADRLNLTLEDPNGNRVEAEGDFWSSETAVFFLYFPETAGDYLLSIQITNLSMGEDISYSGTCNHPISTELKPAQPREFSWPLYMGIAIVLFSAFFLATLAYITARKRAMRSGFIIEEAFVVHRDGRLVASISRTSATPDAELMSGMLVAIRGFIEEGLRSRGALESIRYGDGVLVMASGRLVVLAVRGLGEPSLDLKAELESVVWGIELRHGPLLDGWSGDKSTAKGIKEDLGRLLSIDTAAQPREGKAGKVQQNTRGD